MTAQNTDSRYETLRLIEAVDQLAEARVLILGDVMLDEYLMGDADRISPEAPVPVVRIEQDRRLVGGAGNVARNIVSLGARTQLIGVRGDDAAGTHLVACLDGDGIAHDLVILPERRTTVKTRVLARQQQVVRIDRECSEGHSIQETKTVLERLEAHLSSNTALIISDYGKGLVTEKMMAGLGALHAKCGRPMPLLVDPKPQNAALYKDKGITLLTPNAKEASETAGLPVKSKKEIIAAGKAIMQRTGSPSLVITLGSRGMAVFEANGQIRRIPTVARDVFDVTGAGDTVIAVLAMGLALGKSLIVSCLLANYAAGIVVGEVGASAVTPNRLAEAIATVPRPEMEIW